MKKIDSILNYIVLALGLSYFVCSIFIINDNKIFHILNSLIINIILIMYILNSMKNIKIYKYIFPSLIALILIVSMMTGMKKKEVMLSSFVNKSLNEVLSYSKLNNIIIEQTYEYSDNVEEFYIISQDLDTSTPLKEVTKLNIVVSEGPNYDKKVIIPNLIGLKLEDLKDKIKNLKLNNVIVKFVKNDSEKNTIITQNNRGELKRNSELIFEVSLGPVILDSEIEMIDLKNMSLFDATLWLNQNSIKYNLNYEFDELKKDYIISQDIKENTKIKPSTTTINIIVSKGKSIIVENLASMTSDEIIDWVSKNNLKVEFTEENSTTIPKGNVISFNYKENDSIASGTLIKVIISKGKLLFPEFKTLNEFKVWANENNITYNEEYQMNNDVTKGGIIKFSCNKGDIIEPSTVIKVMISTGKPIKVPNFYNLNQNSINISCNNLGLICAFYDAGYSSIASGNAINQDIVANAVVTNGTYIKIGISKGPATTYTVRIPSATIASCSGDSAKAIETLRTYLNNNYPGVTFNFITKTSSIFTFAGNIHESSEVSDGTNVTQGKTYTVIITK